MDEKQRFCFARDDDGHDYLIPLELRTEFKDEMERRLNLPWGGNDYRAASNSFEEKFGEMRIGESLTNYSFIDPAGIG